MNQILYDCNANSEVLKINNKNIVSYNNPNSTSIDYADLQSNYFAQNVKHIKWYKVIFFTALILLIFFIILFLIRLYENIKNEEISKKLTSSYSISTMFSNSLSNNYSTNIVDNPPFVIRNN